MSAVAIVPAAGQGERFGSPQKLLADVGGTPMLARTIRTLLDGGVERIMVVTAPGSALSALAILDDPRVATVVNADPSRGMFSSIQAGIAAAGANSDPILVHPGDMPFVQPQTVAAVLAASRIGDVVTPRYGAKRGHPVALPGHLRVAILSADPASNLSAVLKAAAIDRLELEVDDPGVLRDVDTPQDLSR
jgi:molybdenum cofactor cytidylyltransferase